MTTKRIRRGTWKSLEYTIGQAKKIMENEGWTELPNAQILAEAGYSNITNPIIKYHGGFHKFRELLGQKQKKAKDGTWMNLGYTLEQAREIMAKENWNDLPNKKVLVKAGYSNLANAISTHFEGFRKFRELLNQEQKEKEKKIWMNLGYTLEQAREIMAKENWNDLPNKKVLVKAGYSNLANAISRYHNGYPEFRERLNLYLGKESENKRLEDLLKKYLK